MRRRQLKWLWKRLGQLAAMDVAREELLMKLGAARSKAPTAWRLVDIDIGPAKRHLHLPPQPQEAARAAPP